MSHLSPLEEQFPRLVAEIVAFWGLPSCFDQLQGLLVDSRGGRQGFPENVYSDLSLLLRLVPRPKGPHDIWDDVMDTDKTS
ncbi:MAG: hypothetical protein ACM3KD_05835 [Hyphomicrobiaceae bacterium]